MVPLDFSSLSRKRREEFYLIFLTLEMILYLNNDEPFLVSVSGSNRSVFSIFREGRKSVEHANRQVSNRYRREAVRDEDIKKCTGCNHLLSVVNFIVIDESRKTSEGVSSSMLYRFFYLSYVDIRPRYTREIAYLGSSLLLIYSSSSLFSFASSRSEGRKHLRWSRCIPVAPGCGTLDRRG